MYIGLCLVFEYQFPGLELETLMTDHNGVSKAAVSFADMI